MISNFRASYDLAPEGGGGGGEGSRFNFEAHLSPEESRLERLSDKEVQECVDTLNKILAKLVESSGDLSAHTKGNLRQQLQTVLYMLGIQDMEDFDGFRRVYDRIQQGLQIGTPEGYPEKEAFAHAFTETIQRDKLLQPEKKDSAISLNLRDLSLFAQIDWLYLKGRMGKEVVEYLYELGKLMHYPGAYEAAFPETDEIEIGDGWQVENGRHRVSALKILGEKTFQKVGAQAWIHARHS